MTQICQNICALVTDCHALTLTSQLQQEQPEDNEQENITLF